MSSDLAQIDVEALLKHHNEIYQLCLDKGATALKNIDPEQLTVAEIIALLKFALDGQRLLLGLATERKDINVSGISDDELKRLAQ